jgi:hypothetical protein
MRIHGHHKICRTKRLGNKRAWFMISVWIVMLFLQVLSVVFHKQFSVSKLKKVRVRLIKKHANKRYG